MKLIINGEEIQDDFLLNILIEDFNLEGRELDRIEVERGKNYVRLLYPDSTYEEGEA